MPTPGPEPTLCPGSKVPQEVIDQSDKKEYTFVDFFSSDFSENTQIPAISGVAKFQDSDQSD